MTTLLCMLLCAALAAHGVNAIPADPHYFTQRVDHFTSDERTYQQRYYLNETSFGKNSGSPIIMIMGGEGEISPQTGIFYPSIVLLAERLHALIIEPEHRGYGTSQPTPFNTSTMSLITPQQALADAVDLIAATQAARNCTGRAGSGRRCPGVTVGGSYPGWLSAMMRLRYPGVVDAAYSASSPIQMYAQAIDQFAYYRIVTESAARASPACPDAVRAALAATLGAPGVTKDAIVTGLNLCTPLPRYIGDNATLLVEEVSMVFMYSWANLNMANYPPPNTGLLSACRAIETAATPWAAVSGFLASYAATAVGARGAQLSTSSMLAPSACYNLSLQLPSGHDATISSGDWSGVGTGDDGSSWDFETCTFLVEAIGTNNVTDMFLPRTWTLEWLTQHCQARFGVTPSPRELANIWGFDIERLPSVTSRIVFTNGLNDGWAAGGVLTNLSDTLLTYNIPDGAHHSDLARSWPSAADTPDVTLVRALVADVIAGWLRDVAAEEAAAAAGVATTA